MVYPRLSVIPMGWSWALWMCQTVHERIVEQAGASPENRIVDKQVTPDLHRACHSQYVDNFIAVSTDASAVRSLVADAIRALEGRGLVVHEEEYSGEDKVAQVWGWQIDGSRGRVAATPVRLWRARLAIRAVLRRGRCSGRDLERLLGHLVFLSLVRREGLSLFWSCYAFVRKNCTQDVRLWASVRRELSLWDGLAPLLWRVLRAGWSDEVVAVDASEWGLGACAAHCGASLGRSVGRASERWRWGRVGAAMGPRRHALDHARKAEAAAALAGEAREAAPWIAAASDVPGPECAPPQPPLAGSGVLDSPGDVFGFGRVKRVVDFPEVPREMIELQWSVVGRFLWRRKGESIAVYEARATLYGFRHLLRSSRNLGKHLLVLGDSQSTAGAVTRFRSDSRSVMRVAQAIAALSLATGSALHYRWLPSEWNASGLLRFQAKRGATRGAMTANLSTSARAPGPPRRQRAVARPPPAVRRLLAVACVAAQRRASAVAVGPTVLESASVQPRARQKCQSQFTEVLAWLPVPMATSEAGVDLKLVGWLVARYLGGEDLASAPCWATTLHAQGVRRSPKTDKFDKSIRLDLERHAPLVPGLKALSQGRSPPSPLVVVAPQVVVTTVCNVVRSHKLDVYLGDVPLSQLKHGGASHDSAKAFRGLKDVWRRGRWRWWALARRYAKGSRLGQVLLELPKDLRAPALSCERSMASIVRFFLEVFSGSGRLGQAVAREGVDVLLWDVELGADYDLRLARNRSLIRGWIRSGIVIGPPPLRSNASPMGLNDLNPADADKVRVGNLLMFFSVAVMREAMLLGIPATLENPARSRIWICPATQRLQKSNKINFTVTDFCMWGAQWRKSTGFLSTGLCMDALAEARCLGAKRGLCKRSGQPRIPIQGKNDKGVFWSKIAEPYPPGLCRALASIYYNAWAPSRAELFTEKVFA
ncbi:unnamed protein product, partial [Prorocentrum cordatum]